MWNTIFVSVHAAAAVVAFVAGLLAVPAGRWLGTHRAALVVMAAALVPALAVDWVRTAVGARAVFGGLLALAVVMVVRSELAARRSPAIVGRTTTTYLDHLGFTLISLANGFAIVTALRVGAPVWIAVVVAVGVVLAGRTAIAAAGRRFVVPQPVVAPTG